VLVFVNLGKERLELLGNLAGELVLAGSKRTHKLQINRNGVVK